MVQNMYVWIWLGALVLFIIWEAVTAQVVSIWFVAGSLVAFILALLKASLGLQIAAFVIVSAVSLILLRPIVKKRLEPKHVATNADRILGASALVTTGASAGFSARVMADGQDWSAVCDEDLAPGDRVIVNRIAGVTLHVTKVEKGD